MIPIFENIQFIAIANNRIDMLSNWSKEELSININKLFIELKKVIENKQLNEHDFQKTEFFLKNALTIIKNNDLVKCEETYTEISQLIAKTKRVTSPILYTPVPDQEVSANVATTHATTTTTDATRATITATTTSSPVKKINDELSEKNSLIYSQVLNEKDINSLKNSMENGLTVLRNLKESDKCTESEECIKMLDELQKMLDPNEEIHSSQGIKNFLELFNKLLSIMNSKSNAYGLENCESSQQHAFTWINSNLSDWQIYIDSVINNRKFELLLVPKITTAINESELSRKNKLEWIKNKSEENKHIVEQINNIETNLLILKNNPNQFYECKQKIEKNCNDLNIDLSLLESICQNPISNSYNLGISIEFILNKIIDKHYYCEKLKDFFKNNMNLILGSFFSILPPKLKNACSSKTALDDIFINLQPIDTSLEGHHEGKQVYQVEIIHGEEKFSFVCKPRAAPIDKAVIDIFKEINLLSPIGTPPLPEYIILDPKNEKGWKLGDIEVSLWEFINGKTLEKLGMQSAGYYIFDLKSSEKYYSSSKERENVEKLQQKLNRMDSILSKLEISDLHKQNIIVVVNFEDASETVFFPIDLEVIDSKGSMLGGKIEDYTLSNIEQECIKKFNIQGNIFRVLPANTDVLQANLTDIKYNLLNLTITVNMIIQNLQISYNLDLGVENILERGILHDIMHGDVPFLTEFNGILYYEVGIHKNKIGERKQ